jgi:hypothetical protein
MANNFLSLTCTSSCKVLQGTPNLNIFHPNLKVVLQSNKIMHKNKEKRKEEGASLLAKEDSKNLSKARIN